MAIPQSRSADLPLALAPAIKMLSEEQMHAVRQAAQKVAVNENYSHWAGAVKTAHERNEVAFDAKGDLSIGANFRNNALLKLYQFAKCVPRSPIVKPLLETCPKAASELSEKLDSALAQTRKDLAAARAKA